MIPEGPDSEVDRQSSASTFFTPKQQTESAIEHKRAKNTLHSCNVQFWATLLHMNSSNKVQQNSREDSSSHRVVTLTFLVLFPSILSSDAPIHTINF